jgi:alanine racemase
MDIDDVTSRTWVEIDMDAVLHNVRSIRAVTQKKAKIMAVVKADAYGHGVQEIAKILIESNQVDRFAVSMLDEAIEMRNSGITVPILVLGYTRPSRAQEIIAFDITQSIFDHELAQIISEEAVKMYAQARVHIKIDTGMGRVGFLPGYRAVKDIARIASLPNVILEGIFTHFSCAGDSDSTYSDSQLAFFLGIDNELKRIGIHIPIRHISNSAGIMAYQNAHLDMVRPGLILYGLYPSEHLEQWSDLRIKPAMSFKTRIIQIKTLPQGASIGYDKTFTTQHETVVATLSAGYADGLSRRLSNTGHVLIAGQRCPIIGKICMDLCMVDISGIKQRVKLDDEAVIYGLQGTSSIRIEELAERSGQINYELCCIVGRRVPRVYLMNQAVYKAVQYLAMS